MTFCSQRAVCLIAGAILTCARASDEVECDFARGASTHLLQTARTIQRAGAHELASHREFASVALNLTHVGSDQTPSWLPLRWLHVQKCASSFGNSLLHVPGTCLGIPGDFFWGGVWDSETIKFPCPGLILTAFGGHFAVGGQWDLMKGNLATTLRQPSQRLLSAFYYAQELNGSIAQQWKTIPEFAVANQGALTKLLTHEGWIAWGHEGHNLTEADALLAAERIQEGFVFVGFVEQWDLSICLFNKMFNMDCMELQFRDTTPTAGDGPGWKNSSTGQYDESLLEGFWDQYDEVPYKSGQEFFELKIREYGVSDASCSKCWAQKGQLSQ